MSGLPESPNIVEIGKSTQFKPGQSGNPNGRPKGSKNWSTIVQDLLMDEDFAETLTGHLQNKMPWWDKLPNKNMANIIASSMMLKALSGDKNAAEWLRKTGYGDKLDITTDGDSLNDAAPAQAKADKFAEFMQTQVDAKKEEPTKAIIEGEVVAPAPAAQPQQPAPIVGVQPPAVIIPTPAPVAPVDIPAHTLTSIPTEEAPHIPTVMTAPFTRPDNLTAIAVPATPAPVQQPVVPASQPEQPQQQGIIINDTTR